MAWKFQPGPQSWTWFIFDANVVQMTEWKQVILSTIIYARIGSHNNNNNNDNLLWQINMQKIK